MSLSEDRLVSVVVTGVFGVLFSCAPRQSSLATIDNPASQAGGLPK